MQKSEDPTFNFCIVLLSQYDEAMRRILTLNRVIAIPLQHRVEVFVLEKTFLKVKSRDYVLYDHSTGIWYGYDKSFEVANESEVLGTPRGRPTPSPSLRKELHIAERFTGVVAACVVAFESGGSPMDASTTIYIDVD